MSITRHDNELTSGNGLNMVRVHVRQTCAAVPLQ